MNTIADAIVMTALPLEQYRKLQGQVEELAIMERFILDLEKAQHNEE